jgi:hypothetical protein
MAKKSKSESSPKKQSSSIKVVSKSNDSLPPWQILWQESWESFTHTWLSYAKLIAIGFALFFVSGMIGLLFALPLGISFLGSHEQTPNHLSVFQSIMFIVLIIWSMLSLLASVIYTMVVPIASVLILDNPNKQNLREILRESKLLFIPYFLTGLMGAFLIMGGFFLLVFPGLLISFFFLFVIYEIVLEKQKGSTALKTSYFLVRNHFWQIVGRYLLVEIIVVLLTSALNKLAGQSSLFLLLSLLFVFAAGWFMQTYLYFLYKQVKTVSTKVDRNVSMGWIWIVAGLGWSLFFVSIIAIGEGLAHVLKIPTKPLQDIPPGTV